MEVPMTKTLASTAMLVSLLTVSGAAAGAQLKTDRFYVGAGINQNDVDGADATGYQFFGGYKLPVHIGRADTAIEVGYWNSGDFDVYTPAGRHSSEADGLWANGVISLPLNDRVDLIGRAGADFGDDDGLMAGGGLGFDLGPRVQLRGEYVVRDRTDSLQANLVYSF